MINQMVEKSAGKRKGGGDGRREEWNRPEGTFDLGEHRGSTFREV